MDKHLLVSRKDHIDKQSLLIQIDNEEKQLWALIHRKGPLHSDVEKLYCKVRSIYEEIIIDCNELEDLRDTEYSLWKLHYKHIDEFRKRAQKSPNGAGSTRLGVVQSVANVQRSNDNHRDGFNLFLSEASQFYQSLILKIRRCYGLPEEAVLYKEGGMYTTCAPETLRKCQFLSHRFFVCLGDLARYKELYGKPDAENHNWSIAATHYLEATMIWPDSGNPHNQLALLATYVSDEFLALYHCIRSLAVKEPFPDAWNNLILLFEKNRSSDLDLHPREACSDFGILSERITVHTKSQSSDDFGKSSMPGAKHDSSMKTNLWSLFIRTISFFFTKFSLDDFLCAFTSMMRELDALMTLDETNLKSALESYKCMNSARKGPFRTLQVVSVFIFIFQNQVNILEQEDLEPESCEQQLVLVQWALMVIFTFMGRLVDRCLKASPSDCSPISPAILVFVEWLVGMVDKADKYATDEKSTSAMSDFFSVLSGFLNQINISEGVVKFAENIPLWEYYELRGYAPAAGMHESLDFSTQCSDLNDYASTSECRIGRIVNATLKIASRASVSRKWICYEKLDRKFLIPQSGTSGLKVNEPHQHASEEIKECESHSLGENHYVNGRSIAMEEEEIILFEPLRRYNSVPLSASTTSNDPKSRGDTRDKPVPSDECLRHAASLLVAQSRDSSNPSSIQHMDPDSKCSKPLKQPGTSVNNTVAHPSSEASISAGPPSLNAWVINRGNLGMDKEKSTSDIFKYGLNTVEEEIASTSLSVSDISIGETEDAVSSHYPCPTYSPPVPSAPLLPEDAVWFSGIPSDYPELRFGGVNNPYGYGGLQYPNPGNDYGTVVPGSKAVYPPLCGMTSSEWLRQYREHRNLEQVSNHMQQAPDYASRSYGELRECDLIGRWGNPLASNPFMAPPPSFVPLYGKRFHGGYQAMTSTKKNG